MANKKLDAVEILLRNRNVTPYCWRDSIEDVIYWKEPLLGAFVDILEMKDEHPNWNDGVREGTIITMPFKDVVLTRRDVTKSEIDTNSDYVIIPSRAVFCPIICMGRGSYGIFSVHKGRAGFLYESIKKAFETYVPTDRWMVDIANAHFYIDGKEIAGMLTESFNTQFYEYTIEMGFIHIEKDNEFYNRIYAGIPGFHHGNMVALLDLVPDLNIYAFFDSIYNSIDGFYNS